MIVRYRIPTDQYAYVEVEEEVSNDAEGALVRETYERFKTAFAENPGVPRKDFNKFLDDQLQEIGGDSEVLAAMNERQLLVVQEVKKAIDRINNKK